MSEIYVECRECSCGHVGINDESDTLAACHNCDWSGPSPAEDHCPGCADGGCMGAACPKCGAIYKLLAEGNLAAPLPAAPAPTELAGELPQDDSERVAFEAWASEPIRADKLPLTRWPLNGGYVDTRTYTAFYGWKSGRAALAARQAPTEAVNDFGPIGFGLTDRQVLLETADLLMDRNWRGDLAETLRDMAARQVPDTVRDAALDVLAERQRQKDVEGWTPEHDDEHGGRVMAEAAACYISGSMYWSAFDTKQRWPWAPSWWKPKDPRRNLVRAAALLIAEIERLDRAAIAQEKAS